MRIHILFLLLGLYFKFPSSLMEGIIPLIAGRHFNTLSLFRLITYFCLVSALKRLVDFQVCAFMVFFKLHLQLCSTYKRRTFEILGVESHFQKHYYSTSFFDFDAKWGLQEKLNCSIVTLYRRASFDFGWHGRWRNVCKYQIDLISVHFLP